MGQYYRPVIIDDQNNVLKTMYSHEFDNGLKLMEHSWLGNKFVQVFESLLALDGPARVVWAGDYADPEVDTAGNPVLLYSDSEGNSFYVTREALDTGVVSPDDTYEANLYHLASMDEAKFYRPNTPAYGKKSKYEWYYANGRRREKPKITYYQERKVPPNAPAPAVLPTTTSHPFLINHDKGEYVDKRKVPKDSDGWRIHPLPLLTVEGNGRGGGDFRGDDKIVGSWARDRISLAAKRPKGMAEVRFDLVEDN